MTGGGEQRKRTVGQKTSCPHKELRCSCRRCETVQEQTGRQKRGGNTPGPPALLRETQSEFISLQPGPGALMDQEIRERLKGKYGGQMRGHKEEGEGG